MLVRRGKGDKRREVGMDRWAWAQLKQWLEVRATLPAGALFCVGAVPHVVDYARLPGSAVSSTAPLKRPGFAVASRQPAQARAPGRDVT